MYLDMNKSSKHVNENNEYDPDDADESMGEIDNEWYTFVKNAKIFVPKIDTPVQDKEFYLETEPTSSNENEDDKHLTEVNENGVDKFAKEIDYEWCTFVANDKKQDLETDMTLYKITGY